MNKIMVVEDNDDINRLIYEALKNEYSVIQAYSGTEAKQYIDIGNIDLVITDLMLPGLSGENLIKYIRMKGNVPIIVITAKAKIDVLVDVLSLGANDYLPKPFNMKELIARTKVQLRSYKLIKEEEVLIYQDFMLDRNTFSAAYKDCSLNLLQKEFDILEIFLREPNRVFTKEYIYEYVWKERYYGDDNTINVHISRLRNKIKKAAGKEYIKTIWGLGYRFHI
jgi:DNA-binding response OmpR family regulator